MFGYTKSLQMFQFKNQRNIDDLLYYIQIY